jgi:hypothetical protein
LAGQAKRPVIKQVELFYRGRVGLAEMTDAKFIPYELTNLMAEPGFTIILTKRDVY